MKRSISWSIDVPTTVWVSRLCVQGRGRGAHDQLQWSSCPQRWHAWPGRGSHWALRLFLSFRHMLFAVSHTWGGGVCVTVGKPAHFNTIWRETMQKEEGGQQDVQSGGLASGGTEGAAFDGREGAASDGRLAPPLAAAHSLTVSMVPLHLGYVFVASQMICRYYWNLETENQRWVKAQVRAGEPSSRRAQVC